ncbi:hypothetical protein SLS55_001507 [Diplodia seriata]|uniref:Uncharacterized protein n=1 Tax=Diplodia seriata TaxID=420778 RepID=A0ABR3CSN7_9PEZI
MERQAQHGTAANVDLDIPDSDPVTTDLLWSNITMASDPIDTPTANPTTATSSTAKISKKSNKSTTKSASIDDVDFEHTVLRPRGVIILQKHTELLYENAFAHFGTEKAPTSHKAAHYLGKHDPEIEVFLDGGSAFEKRIGIEYKTADSWRLAERRFSNLAIKYFLVQQLMDMDHDKNEIFLPERWDEESIQPDPATDWNAFPILAEEGRRGFKALQVWTHKADSPTQSLIGGIQNLVLLGWYSSFAQPMASGDLFFAHVMGS